MYKIQKLNFLRLFSKYEISCFQKNKIEQEISYNIYNKLNSYNITSMINILLLWSAIFNC